MQTYRHTEKMLYSYKENKVRQRIREMKLNSLEVSLPNQSYEDVRIQKSEINKIVEESVINNIEKKNKIKKKYEETEKELLLIDYAVSGLSKTEKEIIDLKYFQNRTWGEIADKLYISPATAKRRRRQAVESITDYINTQ